MIVVQGIGLHQHGGPEVLEAIEISLPDVPPPGFVRVKPLAVSLNHLDIWVRRGLPNLKLTYPHRLGSDVSGVVESLGDGVVGITLGDRILVAPATSCGRCVRCLAGQDNLCRSYKVLGENTQGVTADLIDIPAANILPWPGTLSASDAASLPLTFLTAWQMVVDKAHVRPGQTVLVHAAGSGVSVAAIQIAKLFGAEVIATSSSQAKLARAAEFGMDHGICTTDQDFVVEAKRITNKRGVDVVIEHLGGEVFARSLLALTNGGILVTCGATAGPRPEIDLRHVFFRQLQIFGSTMGSRACLHELLPHVTCGKLRPVVDRVLPFTVAGAREAHRSLEAREVFGKIVLAREVT